MVQGRMGMSHTALSLIVSGLLIRPAASAVPNCRVAPLKLVEPLDSVCRVRSRLEPVAWIVFTSRS